MSFKEKVTKNTERLKGTMNVNGQQVAPELWWVDFPVFSVESKGHKPEGSRQRREKEVRN